MVDDVESALAEVGGAQGGELVVEPRRVDQRDPLGAQGPEAGRGGVGGAGERDAPGPLGEPLEELLLAVGAQDVGGAGEPQGDGVQRGGREQLDRVVDEGRVDEGAHRVVRILGSISPPGRIAPKWTREPWM